MSPYCTQAVMFKAEKIKDTKTQSTPQQEEVFILIPTLTVKEKVSDKL